MADNVAAAFMYRRMMWSLATLPCVEVRSYGEPGADFPALRVMLRLSTRWDFDVSSLGEDRNKVTIQCNDVVGAGRRRRAKIESVVGTITGWASDLDARKVEREAQSEQRRQEVIDQKHALLERYEDVVKRVNSVTGNKRKQRFERHLLHLGKRHPEAGHFDFMFTDDGRVLVEIQVDKLPSTQEGRDSVSPTVQLLHAVIDAIAECRVAYARMDTAAEAIKEAAVNG